MSRSLADGGKSAAIWAQSMPPMSLHVYDAAGRARIASSQLPGGSGKQVFLQTDESDDAEGYANDIDDDFIARNGRRRTSYTTASPDTHLPPNGSPRTSPTFSNHPRNQYGEPQSSTPYYVETEVATQDARPNQEVANETAAALFKTPINTPGDALHLLLEASGRTESLQRQDTINQGYQALPPASNPQSTGRRRATRPSSSARQQRREDIDPAITGNPQSQDGVEMPGVADALKSWSRLRFVRAGWFTAQEAISYVD
ncbi:MAG: hypothetical protein Q9208_000528 [Pyrenodesmia sp. 3 TL-2023]